MQSYFLVLDGPDGSGTSLHTRLLATRLRHAGLEVVETAEPSIGPIGRQIRGILNSHEDIDSKALQLLFCADRAQHIAETIEPALRMGKTVVCDRYTLSTIAYGAAAGIDRAWLETINATFRTPDLTVLTLPSLDVCMERLHRRPSHDALEASELYQRRVYEQYSSFRGENLLLVDTAGSKTDVANFLWMQLRNHLPGIPDAAMIAE